jgi:uncharacterized protein YndB with AHSA1/START domain
MISAPVERVWALLSDPALYEQWQDVKIRSIQLEGTIQPGQKIIGHSSKFGTQWVHITLQIGEVDEARHRVELTTTFSIGLQVHNHIQCAVVNPSTCRVQFG